MRGHFFFFLVVVVFFFHDRQAQRLKLYVYIKKAYAGYCTPGILVILHEGKLTNISNNFLNFVLK